MLMLNDEQIRALRKVLEYLFADECKDYLSYPEVERQEHIFHYVHKLNVAMGGNPSLPAE